MNKESTTDGDSGAGGEQGGTSPKPGFRERRKKLHNVLSRRLPISGAVVAQALAASGIDGDRRPQTLSVDEWLALHATLGTLPGGVQ